MRRVRVFLERGVGRFFARAAPARLAAVVVRRGVALRARAVRPRVREAAPPRFERDFVVLDFFRRDFVPGLFAMV